MMVAVLKVSPESLTDPPSSQALTTMAAEIELVLVCDYDAAPGLVGAVRALLPRHRVVALLVDAGLLRHERDLLEAILNDGHLPVVLITAELGAVQVSEWLNVDTPPYRRPESLRSVHGVAADHDGRPAYHLRPDPSTRR
jgi:hypothetical protein